MRFIINKTSNKEYLQIWNDEKTTCVSLGTAETLVSNIIDGNQTNKIRLKLTKLLRTISSKDNQI